VNSTLGGTSMTVGGADALAFGGLDAAVGDAGDGINFEQLASGKSRSLPNPHPAAHRHTLSPS
jgi:hypothetical protein